MNWKQTLISTMLGLAMLVPAFSQAQAATASLDIIVDGQSLLFDVPPQIDGDRALAPMRTVFEGLGADVRWEAATRTAIATKDGITIRLPIGSKTVSKNGQSVTLDVPAKLINSRTMVPVRFISEAFGNQVSWNAATRRVYVKSAKQPPVRIVGADTQVSDTQLQETNDLMKNGLLQQVEQTVGLPFKKPIWIFVTNSNTGYEQSIRWYGEETQAKLVADGSLGVTYGSKVMMPKQKNPTSIEYKMTIAHELTHVLLNQNGGDTLPSWVHEGTAWETGITLGFQNEPPVLKNSMLGANRYEVLQAVKTGAYKPLLDADRLDSQNTDTYNIQAQDHLAYRYLIDQYGHDKFLTYLTTYGQGDHNAFTKVIGLTAQQFETQFHNYLQTETQKTSRGVELRLNITPDHHGSMGLLPQNTSRWDLFDLEPGTHTIRIYKNGQIEGIQTNETWNDPSGASPDMLYLSIEPETPFPQYGIQATVGGIAIMDSFGDYHLNNIWLTPPTGDTIYPLATQLLGVEILDIQTIH